MNIALAITHLYPQAVPMSDFVVQDDSDGQGPYIALWNLDAPVPTDEELQAAWEAMQQLPDPAGPTPAPGAAMAETLAALQAANAELTRRLIVAEDVANTTSENLMALMEYIINPEG